MLKFIDLFAGIGGIRIPFENLGYECVFTSEWNKFCQQTYQANFTCDHSFAGDITKVKTEDIPSHDLLLAGFPCQPFSLAGQKKGFDDDRGNLFFDIVRILKHHKPRAFLLENVKNLKSHDKGNTFKVIIDHLENKLGYHVSYRIINANIFVPQSRERVFIIGFKGRNDFDINLIDLDKYQSNKPRLRDILHPEDGSEDLEEKYTNGELACIDKKYTISNKLWFCLKGHREKHEKRGNGFGYSLFTGDDIARTISARYHKDGSEVLIKQKNKNPRRLTPRECARLMGFPDSFKIPVSDTQAYQQFGNSVVVPVINEIAKHMKKVLDDSSMFMNKKELITQSNE